VIYIRFRSRDLVEWQAEGGFATWNSYRGDLAELRDGGAYTQLPGSNALAARSCGLVEPRVEDDLDPEPDQGAFFLTTGVSIVESSLGTSSAGERPNADSTANREALDRPL
jgi:hypothetical protein